MRRYKAIFLMLILAAVCCLCGCDPGCAFSVYGKEIPEGYKSIKVALCDQNNRIIGMSEEFPVVCKDKFAVVKSAIFDAENFSLERAAIEGRYIFISNENAAAIIILWVLMTMILNCTLLATFIFYTVKKQQLTRKSAILRCVLLSIGEIGFRGYQILTHVIPYFNINDSKLDLTPTILDLPWIMAMLMLVLYLVRVGTRKAGENVPDDDSSEVN